MNIPFLEASRQEIRDAARLAVQSAIAAAVMFSVMQSLGLPERFVGVLSAVLVVQPSVGNTMGKGWERIVATLVGCVLGALCLYVLPAGYGTAAALGFSMLVMNGVAGFRPAWRYGVVAAVALALGSEADILQTAIDRSISIGLGVAIGIAVSWIVWPDKSQDRAQRFMCSALRAAAGCLERTLGESGVDGRDLPDSPHRKYQRYVSNAREAIDNVRLADSEPLKKKLDTLERFHNAIMILERVTEETGDLVRREQEFGKPAQSVRNHACKIATDLADGKDVEKERVEEMRESLDTLREYAAGHRDEAEAVEYRNALVFGLDEVEDTISGLVEQFSST